MDLNDNHIEILTTVRARMENITIKDSRFICNNIETLGFQRFDIDPRNRDCEELLDELDPSYRELIEGISVVLYPNGTVLNYIRDEVRGFDELDDDVQQNYALMARLAWLDRMIETRKIE